MRYFTKYSGADDYGRIGAIIGVLPGIITAGGGMALILQNQVPDISDIVLYSSVAVAAAVGGVLGVFTGANIAVGLYENRERRIK